LPTGPRRRTPGLRREEIAALAGLSPTWYTYLEQGRDIRPSPAVLENLAKVLQLSGEERRYLYLLANGQPPPPDSLSYKDPPHDVIRDVVDLIGQIDLPVYAADIHADLIAWNASAVRWYTDFSQLPADRRNMLWWMLSTQEARSRIVGWADDARDVLGRFRIAAAGRPWDKRFQELIGFLRCDSPEFSRWWAEHDVRDQRVRPRCLRLPDGSALSVQLVVLRMSNSASSVILHVPVPTKAEAHTLTEAITERVRLDTGITLSAH
jgi:transcriptional regulator with XRE-family HTH domain